MSDPSWTDAEPVVRRLAGRTARRASWLGQDELYQQGALVALEALPHWRPGAGAVQGYVGRAVARALTRYLADQRGAPQPASHPADSPVQPDELAGWEPDADLDPVDAARIRRAASQLDPATLGALLGETTLGALCERLGVSRRTASRRKADALARLVRVVR